MVYDVVKQSIKFGLPFEQTFFFAAVTLVDASGTLYISVLKSIYPIYSILESLRVACRVGVVAIFEGI